MSTSALPTQASPASHPAPAARPSAPALAVKICGLSSEEAVRAALAAGADMVGFVFFPRSPRHVSIDRAAALANLARGRAEIVALTVDADDACLDAIAAAVAPDWFQLHGSETNETIARLRARHGRPVMKAFGISSAADLDACAGCVADRLLFDAKPPRGADRPGGNGEAFDWSIIAGRSGLGPFMLSGGLTPATVGAAVAALADQGALVGLDVSSGVERAPGIKDPALIEAFIREARIAASARLQHQNGVA